jgi:hypothetical protein
MIRISVSTASTSVVNKSPIALYYSGTIKWWAGFRPPPSPLLIGGQSDPMHSSADER